MEDLENIREIVFRYYGLEPDLINSKSRIRPISNARQIVHYFSRKYTNFSLTEIGWFQGMKNHATVLYSNKIIKTLLTCDKILQKDIEEIEAIIKTSITGESLVIQKDGYKEIYHAKEKYSRIK